MFWRRVERSWERSSSCAGRAASTSRRTRTAARRVHGRGTLAGRSPGGRARPAHALGARAAAPCGLAASRRRARSVGRAPPGRPSPSPPLSALLTFAAAGLAWLASRPRFVLQVPDGTVDLLDDITVLAARASVAAFVIGLAAMVLWCVRAAAVRMRSRDTRGCADEDGGSVTRCGRPPRSRSCAERRRCSCTTTSTAGCAPGP